MANQEHCATGELLAPDRESQFLECKATLRTHAATGEVCETLETASVTTIAAFANSRDGGTLPIGVADHGSVTGLERDDVSLAKKGVEAQVTVDQGGQLVRNTAFFVRLGNGTREIHDADERQRYVGARWGSAS